MRYGVLVDLARQVVSGQPVDVTMGYFNVIWQGDANAMALASLAHATSPALVLNLAGPELLSVRETRQAIAARLGVAVSFTGREAPDALLSDGSTGLALLGRPRVAADTADRVDRRLGAPRRRLARQAHALRVARRAILMTTGRQHARRASGDGLVIPAHPLALTDDGRFDERRQRALTRYYIAAGAGGLARRRAHDAVRHPRRRESACSSRCSRWPPRRWIVRTRRASVPLVRIGGICGPTDQALAEADLLARSAITRACSASRRCASADDDTLIGHCRRVSERLPLVGFYLQPSVGGRPLATRSGAASPRSRGVVAIKIAPFNRYQTLDVVRAVADAGRDDIALYTGNDDHIVARPGDAVPVRDAARPRRAPHRRRAARALGGLDREGRRAARRAVRLPRKRVPVPAALLRTGVEVTDANAAFFDAANGFAGCIAGLHEVLRRQGLLTSIRCLDPHETLSPGQREEIDRVYRSYPHLNDDEFVAAHLTEWLRE